VRTEAQGHGGTGARGRPGARARCGIAAAAAVLGAGAFARAAPAQDSPVIRQAVELAAEGRGDSARRIVAAELARARPGDSAYVEALYWRGRLATSGDSAEMDLRRVAIQYSTSKWADQALLQLAQLAMAAANPASALALSQRLRNDYPGSPLRPGAALWAGRAAFELGDPVTACAMLDSAGAESAGDIEFANRVAFYRSRCPAALAAARAAQPDTGPPPGRGEAISRAAPARPDTSAAAAPAGGFEVQVLATRSLSTASRVLAQVQRAGQRGRIVQSDDGLYRVRAGPYPTEAAATAVAERLRRAIGGRPFVVPSS
jgi:cell division septation protein DedD